MQDAEKLDKLDRLDKLDKMDKLDRLDTGLSSPKTQHPLQETLLKGPKPIELIKSFE